MESLTTCFETNESSLRIGAIRSVSKSGLITIIPITKKTTGPSNSNSGKVSLFIIPSWLKIIEMANEGIRLEAIPKPQLFD
jgi:hypothetical protein